MNRSNWTRLLSALMCLALLLACVPSGAEVAEMSSVEIIESQAPAAPSIENLIEAPAGEAEDPANTDVSAEAAPEIPAAEPDAPSQDVPVDEAPEQPGDPLTEIVSQWISALNAESLSDDGRKALWLYDRLIGNLVPGSADDALTALSQFSASSLGYARAYEVLMRAAGIECVTVIGATGAWNIAKLNGAWTHIDAFADDAPDSFGIHFGLTDAAMARDHRWDASAVPACSETKSNYFIHERGYRSFVNSEDLSALLASAAEEHVDRIFLYNAGTAPSIASAVNALLPEIGALSAAETSEQGCYAAVLLHYAESPIATLDAVAPIAIEPSSIVPKVSSLTLGVGEKDSVAEWTLLPAGAEAKVTYTSASTKIATVDANGNVTAKKAGTTSIIIAADTGVSCKVSITVKKAPTSVSFVAERTTIAVGETLQLGYKLSSGAVGKVAFSVPANQNIASITADGLVTALNPGNVTVTVATYNGKKKTGTLTVKAAPTSIELSRESISIGVGDTFTPVATLSANSMSAVTYASSDPAVASVDSATGKITAAAIGEAVVTATTHNGLTATMNVKVVAAPTGIKLTAAHTSIGVKEMLQLSAALDGFAGDTCTLTYASSKPSIVAFDSTGLILGKKTGTSVITVKAYTGASASVTIKVGKAPTSVSIVADRTVMGVGETMQLGYKLSSGAAGGVTFSVPADQSVASITPDGLVTALNPGTVTVTVTTYNGKTKAGTLSVKGAPTSLTLDAESITLGVGDTFTPVATLSENSIGSVTYASANSAVAAVDANTGKITAAAIGETAVTATTQNGLTASLRVKVIAAPTGVKLTAARTSIGVNEQLQLSTVLEGFSGDTCTLAYASSKPSIVAFNDTGLIMGKKTGTSVITVKTYNGATASVTITVGKAPTSVSIVADRTVMGAGETMQLGYKLSSGAAGGVTFSVPTGQNVASITPDGLVTALNPGTVTVTVTTYNGKTKTGTLSVKGAPTSVKLNVESITLGVGETFTPVATLSENSIGSVTYASANSAVAAVDANTGKITAAAIGETTVTATTQNGLTASIQVKVMAAPTTVKLTASHTTLGVNEKIQLVPEVDGYLGVNNAYTYVSSKTAVATVSDTGVVTAKKTGSTIITVATYNNIKATLTITVKKAPTSVSFAATRTTLGVGETVQLGYTLSSDSAGGVTFSVPADQNVASITEDGLITARNPGSVTVTIATYNGKKKTGTLTVKPAPTSLTVSAVQQVIGVGATFNLSASLNEGSAGEIYYRSDNPEIVSVDASGKVTALAVGKARLTVYTYVSGLDHSIDLEIKNAPSSIAFDQAEYSVDIDGTLQLKPILPEGTAALLTYKIEKAGYFSIDVNGNITPIKRGSSKVTVSTHNGKSASATVWIVDPLYPEIIRLEDTPPTTLKQGDTYTPKLYVFPETARADIQWSSSNANIASVDEKTGTLKALSYGRVTVTGKSQRNASLSVTYTVLILSDERCLVMPAHRTDTSAINATLKQIVNVRDSTYAELNDLVAKGWISSTEMSARKSIIDRAFDMYYFPWMTNSKVLYWKAANSEGGEKDFKPGIVYYGLPYTQTNRVNTRESVISNGYWKNSGKGYYLMQTNTFSGRNYPGSDCSSFVSLAIWGSDSGRRGDSTTKIANASYYKTLSSSYADDMRPGDILVKSGHHVAMFLYYANAARTQIVIIEQGGGGDDLYSNCVSTCIRDVSYYGTRGYKLRRVSSFDMSYMK